MVALGTFVKLRPVVTVNSLIDALPKALSTRKTRMLSLDKKAVRRGTELGLKMEEPVNA